MAQQDTGLGWSAEEDWLVYTDTETLASYTKVISDVFPDQPIPVVSPNASNQEIVSAGYYIAEYVSGNDTMRMYVATTSDAPGYVFVPTEADWEARFIGTFNGQGFLWVAKSVTRDYYQSRGNANATRSEAGYPGLWYVAGPRYFGSNITIPKVTTQEALASFTISSVVFSKPNLGYAVACVVKWKTSNGTELISPILISSNTEFVDMTTTGTGNYMAKFNGLLSGVRFYMAFWDLSGGTHLTSLFQQIDLTGRGNMDLEQLFMTIISTSYAHVIIINSPDPYETGGAGSGEEGGDGEDLEDDEMGISHHAIPAAINTGFCRIYCPSEQQLRDLSNFLWSAQYDLTAVKKLFANPMDSVLGLSAVPLTLSGANHAVYLGGVDTKMSFPMVNYQSYQVPMGAITVEKRWGSYLDYDPYTKFSIYLPFIGFKDLSADDIMGKQIILDYDVDILSGACTARLQAGGNVLYQWSGQCSIQLPVTASNWNQVFQSATSAALSAGLSVATGTAGPVLAGALAAEGVQAIMGKPRIERGGSSSGAAGWMGGLTPYLVRVTPEAIIPSDQNKFIGYPAFSSISLGALTGYNEISSIHLEGIPATGAELDELEAILKGGVIF